MTEAVNTFYLTEDLLKLVRSQYVYWNDQGYLGAPIVDVKRPYGDSDVIKSVAKVIGAEPVLVKEDDGPIYSDDQENHFLFLHENTHTALQIVLVTGEFRPGVYVKKDCYDRRSWKYLGRLPQVGDECGLMSKGAQHTPTPRGSGDSRCKVCGGGECTLGPLVESKGNEDG